MTLAGLVLGASALAGCAGVHDTKGFVMDKQLASTIQPGVDNKDSVAKALGRPTFTGQFDQSEWYYVARKTTTIAFRQPRVTDQTVLRVKFDQAGNVASVNQTGRELVRYIRPSRDLTPTLGRKKSFFDEIFGNIGVVGAAPGAGGDSSPGS
ncbi:outer membrane protein assembly factor BamE [Sphingomonas ginkgonis]|uniref:Outer membrane protein assembly factor BamE n=1 Tax=Sphingomonas ginkgonis TaxID=2315330 RepID=A0A3R9WS83_9SPHN|nr:outer membrane protein assembly factor BamE [Sphingomonas ginkgonis]RST32066.1 outer membrane protein assembly factor BamE [Sphingomonas ginkgonis]